MKFQASSIINTAHNELVELSGSITQPATLSSIAALIANDPQVHRAEKAIMAQYDILGNPTRTTEHRQALNRIEEGMEYWKKLIRKHMGKL
jgi:hypothetical protein